ncbi:hypothetical protein SEA_COMRADE_107 [Streptomyces phage Comrade]|uniref:Uncharacterized protein n=3 Tax=Gilsonvirus comrade TaxID=2846395 RepID=A0A345ME31_9CAUD|nr:hypothetical protein HWB84_gp147 [Streptomyces phage Comrade]AXH68812.1 hypothetical protein SEA_SPARKLEGODDESS_108 [Streptomyces phage SparkleGoddess]AXQ63369.1 hypothetical protein SEA_COMRADE_107 [Streptomyces phage Comrade]
MGERMPERKLTVYYELSDSVDEDAFFEHVHQFFCKNPNDPEVEDCPLYAMTAQDVVEEE